MQNQGVKQEQVIMEQQCHAQALKKEAEQHEIAFRDKIHQLEKKLLETENQQSQSINELKDQLHTQSRKKDKQDDLIQR